MSNPTPIYTEALREAKRRTRKHSPERAVLVEMDERTTPAPAGRASGPIVHFYPSLSFDSPRGPSAAAGVVRDLRAMGVL